MMVKMIKQPPHRHSKLTHYLSKKGHAGGHDDGNQAGKGEGLSVNDPHRPAPLKHTPMSKTASTERNGSNILRWDEDRFQLFAAEEGRRRYCGY